MVAQVPAGAMVDAARSKRFVAGLAVLAIVGSALLLAALPERVPVYLAEVLHGLASCLLTPVIAALSLAVCQQRGQPFGERLGRNARFAAIGSGVAAGLMGVVGYHYSERAVFLLAAALALPALVALRMINPAHGTPVPPAGRQAPGRTMLNGRLLVFALCCGGFTLANAALFPMAAVQLTRQTGSAGQLVIAAGLIVPQVLVAVLSPAVGRAADRWGRRPLLLLGFAAVPLRGLLFALSGQPAATVVFQALDGVSGAVFGVLLPLVVADLTAGTGRFNLSIGTVGLFIGGGAALGTAIAGEVADRFGTPDAFLAMSLAGVLSCAAVWLFLPETRGGASSSGGAALAHPVTAWNAGTSPPR